MIFDKKHECMSREDMRALQSERLVKLVKRVYENNAVYRKKMDELGFGNFTNTGACAAECPKSIPLSNIARLNREFLKAKIKD